jgi:hypothetical protein
MKPAELSCRAVMVSILPAPKASSKGKKLSPGTQNTLSTPFASKNDTNCRPVVCKMLSSECLWHMKDADI